jgi:hypothetical protein
MSAFIAVCLQFLIQEMKNGTIRTNKQDVKEFNLLATVPLFSNVWEAY